MSRNGSGRAAIGSAGAPAVALVHHGHQHLIVDGYDNHEGLSELLDAYTAVLGLHLKYRVPLNLHLSGTLLEAIAWHAPEFFSWVGALQSEGLVEIIGSAYAQPILRLFSPEHNRRQLAEELGLLESHLSVNPNQIKGFWLPERVWHTGELAEIIAAPTLRNGGYSYVLLDDRLAYPDSSGARTVFDASTAPGRSVGPVSGSTSTGTPAASVWALPAATDPDQFLPARIAGGSGLVAVPISGNLRYAIPPRSTKAWHLLEGTLAAAAAAGPDALAVYADDLEKTAAVGPWTSGAWERENVHAYEQLLAWLTTSGSARPVLLSAFLAEHPPAREVEYEPGTFCELAAGGAGEDYSGWWDAPAYAPYRRHLERVERLLVTATPDVDGSERGEGLVELAWKQLMVASYETAWHGFGAPDGEVAPWARATASHVRSALVTLEAARYVGRDRRRRTDPATLWVADVDADGHDEIVLASDQLFAVISPQHGARVVAAYDLVPDGGRQIIGNPIDDWNWQEEINRWMETPANHPGAFTDCGYENARWQLVHAKANGGVACVRLRCVEADSPLAGSVKEYRLTSAGRLEVGYELAFTTERFDVEVGLSPDYLRLLRYGREAARSWGAARRRGVSNGESTVWIELPDREPVLWAATPARPAGHVLGLRMSAYRPTFRITMGTGVPAPEVEALVRQGRRARARRELVMNEMEQRRFRAPRKDT
jgi:hypothetical protein